MVNESVPQAQYPCKSGLSAHLICSIGKENFSIGIVFFKSVFEYILKHFSTFYYGTTRGEKIGGIGHLDSRLGQEYLCSSFSYFEGCFLSPFFILYKGDASGLQIITTLHLS